MSKRKSKLQKGFTLIEIMINMAIIAILTLYVYGYARRGTEKAYLVRAKVEMKVMERALRAYQIEYEALPADVSRNIPPGIEQYLSQSDIDKWPNGPWVGSVYDYDAFMSEGVQTYQISIRFCEIGQPDTCRFPRESWASDFDVNSSVYMCLEGACKSHPNQPLNHPGYCINCYEN